MLKRVLITDDNVYARYVIRTFLQDQTEIKVCGEAVDGVEAIKKTRQLKPDLVLLDLSMPNLNGAEVALVKPDVRIIMFTMYNVRFLLSVTTTLSGPIMVGSPSQAEGAAQQAADSLPVNHSTFWQTYSVWISYLRLHSIVSILVISLLSA
jgi:two-component SAPR family response regulator